MLGTLSRLWTSHPMPAGIHTMSRRTALGADSQSRSDFYSESKLMAQLGGGALVSLQALHASPICERRRHG